jgi:hypothetical protein
VYGFASEPFDALVVSLDQREQAASLVRSRPPHRAAVDRKEQMKVDRKERMKCASAVLGSAFVEG